MSKVKKLNRRGRQERQRNTKELNRRWTRIDANKVLSASIRVHLRFQPFFFRRVRRAVVVQFLCIFLGALGDPGS